MVYVLNVFLENIFHFCNFSAKTERCIQNCAVYCFIVPILDLNNPLVTNGLSQSYHLDESTFVLIFNQE